MQLPSLLTLYNLLSAIHHPDFMFKHFSPHKILSYTHDKGTHRCPQHKVTAFNGNLLLLYFSCSKAPYHIILRLNFLNIILMSLIFNPMNISKILPFSKWQQKNVRNLWDFLSCFNPRIDRIQKQGTQMHTPCSLSISPPFCLSQRSTQTQAHTHMHANWSH